MRLHFGDGDVAGVGADGDAVLVERRDERLLQFVVVRVEVEDVAHDLRQTLVRIALQEIKEIKALSCRQ